MCARLQHRSWGLRASRGSFVSQGKHQPERCTRGESVLNPWAELSRENTAQTAFCPSCKLHFRQEKKVIYSGLNLRFLTRNQLRGDSSGRNQRFTENVPSLQKTKSSSEGCAGLLHETMLIP